MDGLTQAWTLEGQDKHLAAHWVIDAENMPMQANQYDINPEQAVINAEVEEPPVSQFE